MNPLRGEVAIPFGDGTKRMKFTTNSLIELEQALGRSVTRLFSDPDSIGFTELRAMLWAGFRGTNARYTLQQVGNEMKPHKMAEYLVAVSEALNLALGTPKEVQEDNGEDDPLDFIGSPSPTPSSGTGSDSESTPTQPA